MKNKKVENATFNTDHWKGKSKEEFMQAHAGLYMKHFAGYPDQEQRAEKQLSDAYDLLFPAQQSAATGEVKKMDTDGAADQVKAK